MSAKDLIPISARTKDEQKKICSEGGKASGAARRKKRDMKVCMELLLSLKASSVEDYQLLSDMGLIFDDLPEDEINNILVVNAALLARAKTGDVNAIKEMRDIISDNNFQKQKIKLERDKFKLEREKFEYEKMKSNGQETETIRIIDDA